MTLGGPIGWWNTGFPMLVMSALAAALPYALHRHRSTSQIEVAVVIWASAGLVTVLSAWLFAWVYAWQGADVGAAFDENALATVRFFLGRGLASSLVWGPILGLIWFSLAQGVEAERARQKLEEEGS